MTSIQHLIYVQMLGIEIVCVHSSKGLHPTYDIIRRVMSAKRNACAWFKEMESRSKVVEVDSKKTYSNTQRKSQIVWISHVTFWRPRRG